MRIGIISVAMLASLAARAYTVSGSVSDKEGTPESYATVRVYLLPDTVKTASTGITGDMGEFSQTLKKGGDYLLRISSVGKSTLSVPFTVDSAHPDADLGALTIKENAALLGEVEVVATKPLVSKEIDRIGYDVQADEDSKTSNVQDMLRKVPMVTVENDGTIKIKGSTNFKIYKDGRPSNSFTSNAKDIFAAIPASMIEKIEVITDPGAKEDAEGVGAILNIVTVKNTQINGVMGSVRAGMMTRNNLPAGGVWLTGNIGKLVMSANAGYFHQSESMSETDSETLQEFKSGNSEKSKTHNKTKGNFVFYGIDGSYELDSLNLFTLELGGYAFGNKSWSQSTTQGIDAAGSTLYSFNTNTFNPKSHGLEFNGNFNYQHSTRRKGETITFSYQVSHSDNDNETSSQYTDLFQYPALFTGFYRVSDLKFLENTLQADWTRPLSQMHTLAVGAKFISRSNKAKTTTDYEGMDDSKDNFSHLTTIGAAYVDYRFTYRKWSARAGLRYEYSRLSAKYPDGDHDDFGSSLNDWVPNASVMYQISDMSSIKASYSSRINRPGITYLDPAVDLGPTSESYGNPDLSSVHYNSISLNYSLFTRKFNLDLNASYDFTNNAIGGLTWVDDDDFITSTYGNVGRTRSFNFSVFAQWSVTPKTNVMVNASANYQHIRYAAQGLSGHRWGTDIFFRATQTLPWKLRLEGMLYYGSGGLNDVYSYTSNNARGIFHGLSLQRSFLKNDALTVKLHARNPFNSKYEGRTYTVRGDYTGYTKFTMPHMRIFGIELSYRFGSVKASVKKVAAGINNDDLEGGMSAPSSSQGGMSM